MPKADGTPTRSEKKALNKQAFAAARVEMAKIEKTIPRDPYRDEPEDHLPQGMLSGHVLKRKRGDLTDEACINRITDLVACGVAVGQRAHVAESHRRAGWASGVRSITSSARARIDGGTERPSALAVLMLMTRSNFG